MWRTVEKSHTTAGLRYNTAGPGSAQKCGKKPTVVHLSTPTSNTAKAQYTSHMRTPKAYTSSPAAMMPVKVGRTLKKSGTSKALMVWGLGGESSLISTPVHVDVRIVVDDRIVHHERSADVHEGSSQCQAEASEHVGLRGVSPHLGARSPFPSSSGD